MLIRPSLDGVSSVRELFGQDGRRSGHTGPAAFVTLRRSWGSRSVVGGVQGLRCREDNLLPAEH
jgi:hypothetical protein